ncbi:hypothetical protein LTS10_003663 [Elasticomyces elasticus]|nr:hypothetical protein LTS10_003663 [Elasticomyces elasticus]
MSMRNLGFPSTSEGFIHVAVRVQRLIRAGYKLPDDRVDDMVMWYAFSSLTSTITWRDLERSNPFASGSLSPTFNKLTRAIACSRNDLSIQIATDFDVAYAARVAGVFESAISKAALRTLAVDFCVYIKQANSRPGDDVAAWYRVQDGETTHAAKMSDAELSGASKPQRTQIPPATNALPGPRSVMLKRADEHYDGIPNVAPSVSSAGPDDLGNLCYDEEEAVASSSKSLPPHLLAASQRRHRENIKRIW